MKRLLVLGVVTMVLLGTSCPNGSILIEPGSTVTSLAFRVADRERNHPPLWLEVRFQIGISSPTHWRIQLVDDSVSVDRFVYGVSPPGYEATVKPKPLEAGRYEVSTGDAWLEFDIEPGGAVKEVPRSPPK
jgi:hypothetical protein